MARPPITAAVNARGSALVESLPVIGLILIFVTGLLLAGYLIFANQWLQYQGEQGLYCLATTDSVPRCKAEIRTRLARFLPWSDLNEVHLSKSSRRGESVWKIEIQWRYAGVLLESRKELSVAAILRNRDLR